MAVRVDCKEAEKLREGAAFLEYLGSSDVCWIGKPRFTMYCNVYHKGMEIVGGYRMVTFMGHFSQQQV